TVSLDLVEQLPLLLELVFDLEEIGEVRVGLDDHLDIDRGICMIEECDLFGEPIPDGTPTDDREVRIDVNSSGRHGHEELNLEVLELVDGQYVGAVPVHGQHETRQESRIVEEETHRIRWCRLHVAAPIAHDEGVAFQNADGVALHGHTFRAG